MDRKNTVIGILFILAAFAVLFFYPRRPPTPAAPPPPAAPAVSDAPAGENPPAGLPEAADEAAPGNAAPADTAPAPAAGAPPVPSPALATASLPDEPPAAVLENDFIRVALTRRGGAVARVELKKYPKLRDGDQPYSVGDFGQDALTLEFAGRPFLETFEVVEATATKAVLAYTSATGQQVRRTYEISTEAEWEKPYVITHRTEFLAAARPLDLTSLSILVGNAAPPNAEGVPSSPDSFFFINFGFFDGAGAHFTDLNWFRANGGFLGFGAHPARPERREQATTVWASVKNQFFVSILTPKEPGTGLYARPLLFPRPEGYTGTPPEGLQGGMLLDRGIVAAGTGQALDFTYYVGPREFPRIAKLGQRQDEVMQYWVTGWISQMLLYLLIGLHGISFGNWGVAIIILVLVVRGLMWPLTAAAAKAGKRMAKLSPLMTELREKHKDNPERLQLEMAKLFTKYRINPAAGCLPVFFQMPIFIGLYNMLRSSAELRYADFLWVRDLSMPDQIFTIGGFPINLLPLLMGAAMYGSFVLTPMPTVDKTQRTIFMVMLALGPVFCYMASAGLALYWTISSLFTIGQQQLINRLPDPELVEREIPAHLEERFKQLPGQRGGGKGPGAPPKAKGGW